MTPLSEKEKLDTLTRLGIELNTINDLDILLEKLLTQARQFVNADAGSIYIRDVDRLNFTYTQNDTLQRRLPEGTKLVYSLSSIPIDEKSLAGYVATTGEALNIQDVYAIDSTRPYGFSQAFDEKTGYKTKSALTIPLQNAGGKILGILQIINALDADDQVVSFSRDDEQMMFHFASIAAGALERAQMTRQIILRMAAMLHDVGKVAISDMILKKPDRLATREFELMKQHTILGARLFLDRQSDLDMAAQEVALNHHERWDGNGYPGHVDIETGLPLKGFETPDGSALGKTGEEIPLFGRIVSLADVYDALSSRRIYKEAWKEEDVLAAIEEGAGTQFDPELVAILLARMDIIRSVQARYLDSN